MIDVSKSCFFLVIPYSIHSDELQKTGTTEFDYLDSESRDTEPQGEVERTKKSGSDKGKPKTKTSSNWAGSSRGTNKNAI